MNRAGCPILCAAPGSVLKGWVYMGLKGTFSFIFVFSLFFFHSFVFCLRFSLFFSLFSWDRGKRPQFFIPTPSALTLFETSRCRCVESNRCPSGSECTKLKTRASPFASDFHSATRVSQGFPQWESVLPILIVERKSPFASDFFHALR